MKFGRPRMPALGARQSHDRDGLHDKQTAIVVALRALNGEGVHGVWGVGLMLVTAELGFKGIPITGVVDFLANGPRSHLR